MEVFNKLLCFPFSSPWLCPRTSLFSSSLPSPRRFPGKVVHPTSHPFWSPAAPSRAWSTTQSLQQTRSCRPATNRLLHHTIVRGRLCGRATFTIPTAPYEYPSFASPTDPTAVINAPVKPRRDTLPPQKYNPFRRRPSLSLLPSRDNPAVAAAATLRSPPPPSQRTPGGSIHILQSPFHRRPAAAAAGLVPPKTAPAPQRTGRLAAARLWNPTNSTPRTTSAGRRNRRPSSPPPPAIPLRDFDSLQDTPVSGTRDHPLLTLSEQWQARHSSSTRHSFTIDRRPSSDRRVSLPRSVRASYDGKRSGSHSPNPPDLSDLVAEEDPQREQTPSGLDKGKGKAVMTAPENEPTDAYGRDLERGPEVMDPRTSNVSYGDGIGSAISSSNSSIMGEDVQFDGEEWGPLHPCFPHINPHVPIDSPEHTTTRIIRIRRDWLQEGDLAPTFSILYPEILDPAGLSEQEFRRVIDKVNREVVPAFNPYSPRNILDGAMGLVTGWLWDDFGLSAVKSRLNGLEKWIESWNAEMEKSFGSEEGLSPPKLISLRRTGYMSLDIQISDPEITREPSSHGAGDSNTALSLEQPAPAVTAS
ncbi:hypothetical protein NLU13_2873 [Sarocladium strictum]|uniref:Ras modification protein ERF4 n=1 Tax=Sarocladium strictum TaxID=5046 RepID=A0AA39L9R9_SARSR|nr:hypothetical protein NLU13_2873 [Sarocladium strictum]